MSTISHRNPYRLDDNWTRLSTADLSRYLRRYRRMRDRAATSSEAAYARAALESLRLEFQRRNGALSAAAS